MSRSASWSKSNSAAPFHGVVGQLFEPQLAAGVGEEQVAVVVVERGVVLGKISDEHVLQAVAVEVGGVDPHTGLGFAFGTDAGPAPGADLAELAVAVVAIEVMDVGVVGDVHVDVAVAVQVRGQDAQSIGFGRVGHAHFGGRVDERAVAAIVEEVVVAAAQSERADHHLDLVAPSIGALAGEHLRQRASHVVGDVQVQVAVSVGVEKGRSGAPARVGHTGLLTDFLERAVATIAVERVEAEIGDVQVDVSVVVVVGRTDAAAPAIGGQPGALGHILEPARTRLRYNLLLPRSSIEGGFSARPQALTTNTSSQPSSS